MSDMVHSESVTLAAADGQQLSARLFVPPPAQANGLTLQINGATGVPRGYYDAFAAYMAGRGFAALNFDYRGIGGSPQSPGAPAPRMLDWARHDIPAAADFLSRRFPEARPCMMGHSFGGQALGLLPRAEDLAAAVTIGAQQGYWRHWPFKHQVRLVSIWYVAMPLTVAVRGHVPGRMLGGEPLPRGVALDWARWCRTPHYMSDDAGKPLQPQNRRLRAPMRMISFADDVDFGPKRGVDALAQTYAGARVERLHVAPRDWGLQRIGHFGFFKRDMPDERWAELADWLYAAAYRKSASRAA
ncbi:alpha/beta hydrolase [Ferrovibrio sp.]|uniref:alpha/beta hydrolase family protein n=1 Tax=Ferrovibrio sp. TaxID=1917215 RepID=UPI00261E44B6|nr:alpha/beta hydrolase [Ferrovibrio sp.]